MFLPVQIPTSIEQQSPQGGQAIAGGFRPVHALMFLTAGDDQIVAFFDVDTADILALGTTVPVIGQVGLAVAQVTDQFIEFGLILGVGSVLFQAGDGLSDLAGPQMTEERTQQLSFGQTTPTD
jgi:hypothetical protein